MSEHSPLPWKLSSDSIVREDKPHVTILRFSIAYKGSDEYRANIKYTVDALNSYGKHKGIIRNMTKALEGMLNEYDQASRYGSPMARAANERVAFARAALAAAKDGV
jgi:hypothetical protein